MSVPTASELNPLECLDGRVAQRNFLGKTVQDAVALFATQGGTVEDLMWMGHRAFIYYLPAAVLYLEGASADADDWRVVPSLPGTIGFRLDSEEAAIAEAWPTIERLCAYVLSHAHRLMAEEDRVELCAKYGLLHARVTALLATDGPR